MSRANQETPLPLKPIRNAIAYEVTHPDGSVEVASIPAYKLLSNGGFRAWAMHPTLGSQIMEPNQGVPGFVGAKAIIALTHDDIPVLIANITEAVAGPLIKRISDLESYLKDQSELEVRIKELEEQVESLNDVITPPEEPPPAKTNKKSSAVIE